MNNNGSGIHNFCMLISDRGFSNSGNAFKNEGFIWILEKHGNQFANSGTFWQSAGAQFRGVNFANSGYITGGGSYYFSGNTANSAYVGYDGNGINFYDASLSSSSAFFDQQSVAPHSTVSKTAFAPADTNSWGAGGSADAGLDQFICIDRTELAASGSNGKWSIVKGSVDFADINDPNTSISNIAHGDNTLMWSAAASCATAMDYVKITLENPADTSVWLGNIDKNWHNSENWTRCVPGPSTVAIIQRAPNSPEIQGRTAYALKVSVDKYSELRLRAGAKLIVAYK